MAVALQKAVGVTLFSVLLLVIFTVSTYLTASTDSQENAEYKQFIMDQILQEKELVHNLSKLHGWADTQKTLLQKAIVAAQPNHRQPEIPPQPTSNIAQQRVVHCPSLTTGPQRLSNEEWRAELNKVGDKSEDPIRRTECPFVRNLSYVPNPPPLPGRWRCTHAGGCQYVWWMLPVEKYLEEQFSQQRLAVMEAMHMVKKLGPQYVMVEPMFVITPHNNPLIEKLIMQGRTVESDESILFGRYVLRASEVYDLKLLGEYFDHGMGVIPFEDYLALFPDGKPSLDALIMDHPVRRGNESERSDVPQVKCETRSNLNVVREFFNISVTIKSTRCLLCNRRDGYPITPCSGADCHTPGPAYRLAVRTAHGVYLKNGMTHIGHFMWRSVISSKLYKWVQDQSLDYIEIKRKMLFSEQIWNQAQQIVQQLPRPFIAMHIRRGDKLKNDPCRSLQKAIDMMNTVAEFAGAKSVFLMTDIQQDEDIRKISQGMRFTPGVKRLYDFGVGKDWHTEVQDMFVEMAVCTLADFFIPSDRAFWASTTPSRDIIEMRNLVFHHHPFTTVWFGRAGLRWKDEVVDTYAHNKDGIQICQEN